MLELCHERGFRERKRGSANEGKVPLPGSVFL